MVDLTLDNNNDVYVVGTVAGEGKFGNLKTAYYGNNDVFVAKCKGSDGTWDWVNSIGSSANNEYGAGIVYSKSNNQIYIAFDYSGIISSPIIRNNFKDQSQSFQGGAGLFATCTPAGIINTPVLIEANSNNLIQITAIDADNAGNLYTLNQIGTNTKVTYFRKWNITGNGSGKLEWLRYIPASISCEGYGICVDGNQNVYVTGNYQGTIADYKPSANTGNTFDVFWASYDKSGNLRWGKGGGSANTSEVGLCISVGDDGNIAVCGTFNATSQFPFGGSQVVSKGNTDIFAFRANAATGDVVGPINTGGGVGSDVATAVVVKNGKMYVSGNFQGTAAFSNVTLSAPSSGVINLFVAKY